jgi:hypothetical protein
MNLDDLYSLPLEEFTAARNALAKTDPEAKGLRKPSVAAYAVNQLARRHRDELDAFLGAAAELRQAQLRGGDIRDATAEQRHALQRLLQLAGEYAGSAQSDGARQRRPAGPADALAAALVGGGGRARAREPAGFGSLVTGPAPKRRQQAEPKRDREAERKAREALRAAQAELREAEAGLDAAQRRRDEAARRVRELGG